MNHAPNHAPAGWYPDPTDFTMFRYWNGQSWTEHRAQPATHLPPPNPGGSYPPSIASPAPAGAYQTATAAGWPPHPPALRPEGVSMALSGWVQGLLWAISAFSVVAAFLSIVAAGAFQDWLRGPADATFDLGYDQLLSWERAESNADTAGGLATLALVIAGILLMVWMHKAHRATSALNPGPRRWTLGWTVGSWFIPLANWFIVPSVLADIDRIASSERHAHQVSPYWRDTPTNRCLYLWFWLWAAAFGLQAVGVWLQDPEAVDLSDIDSYFDSYAAGYWLHAGSAVLMAVAGAIAAIQIKRLSKKVTPASLFATVRIT